MKAYDSQYIRNIALVGHAGSGKSTLSESMLFASGSINRLGIVEEGTSVSDYHEIEHERTHSVFTTTLFTLCTSK